MSKTEIVSPNESVLVDVTDAIARITVNRPAALNAMSDDVVEGLAAVTAAIREDASVRCIVLQGAGDHFMAGGDVKSFKATIDGTPDKDALREHFETLLHDFHEVVLTLRTLPQPVLASIRGAVAGAGVSMALAADMAIASDDALFTLAYCHLGASPDGGSTFALPRSVGMKRAFEIAYLGDRFDAATAEKWGMINRVVPAGDLAAETDALAARLANGPTRAHSHAKALLNASLANTLEEQLKAEVGGFTDCVTGDDFAEGVTAFTEKRKAEFKGS